jgi:hypothetical protein
VSDEQIRAGFIRNRRFLIAVSVGLACFDLLGLRFPEVTILGNTATVQHPERITGLAWIVWGWAFAQYVVWFRDVGAWNEFWGAVIHDCEQSLCRRIEAEPVPEWLANQLRSELENRLGSAERGDVKFVVRFADITGDGKQIERAAQVMCEAHARLAANQYDEVTGSTRFERLIDAREWRRHMIAAVVGVLLTRRFVVEYFAPFLIGLVPIGMALLRHFHDAQLGHV